MTNLFNTDPLTVKIFAPSSLGDALQAKQQIENAIQHDEALSFSALFLFPHIDSGSADVLTLIAERGYFNVADGVFTNKGLSFEIPYNFIVESKKVKAYVKISANLIIKVEIMDGEVTLTPESPVHVRLVGKPYYQGRELPVSDRLFVTEVKLSSTNIYFRMVENDEEPENILVDCDLINNGTVQVKANLASMKLLAELAFSDGACDQPTNVPNPNIQRICYGPVPEGWYVANITPWSACPGGYQMEIRKLGAEIVHCSSSHTVPPGYVVTGLVPDWFSYDGMKFDKFICAKLGPHRITMCACAQVPSGYSIIAEIDWSPCTGAHFCTTGKAYIIQKI